MPIPFIAHLINLSPVFYEKYVFTNIQKYILLIILFYLLKKCFSGTNNKADRRFNGSVFLITVCLICALLLFIRDFRVELLE